jgi:glucokinase
VDVVADIGGTHTRCGLVDCDGRVLATQQFDNADFEGLDELVSAYLKQRRSDDRPSRGAFAVAAPILSDHIEMTNLAWSFSQVGLQSSLGLRRLIVVNDFEALAWGLADFDQHSREQIGDGESAERGAFAVVGPGSGLGVASLVPSRDTWLAVPGEGGHVTLAASTDEEARIIAAIRDKFQHCSAERVLSGPGLVNLYTVLAQMAGRGTPNVEPADVTSLAQRGEPLATKTLAMFFAFLGTVASDVALTVGARGGIYIAGGIVPRVIDLMKKSSFRSRFEAKGRYSKYLREIPTYVITDRIPAFRGLRRVLGFA